jgi:superfamily II DNA or RNA helicase
MYKLRDYQQTLYDNIKIALKTSIYILVCAVTRSGKTVLFSALAKKWDEAGKKVWIILHRDEIFQQTCEKLAAFEINYGQIKSKAYVTKNNIQVAMIVTLKKRIQKQKRMIKQYGFKKWGFLEKPNVILFDEGHHCASDTYEYIANEYPDVPRIGFTATVNRLDNKPLLPFFDTMILGESMRWMMDNYWITDCIHLCPDSPLENIKLKIKNKDYDTDQQETIMTDNLVIGNIIKHYETYLRGLQTICFVCNQKHAEIMKEKFDNAGYKSQIISSETTNRKTIIDDYRDGKYPILISINIVAEGFDVPICYGVMLLRKTKSESLYLQQVSRCLTPIYAEGYDLENKEERRKAMMAAKPKGIILDFVSAYWEHGRIDKDRNWTLEARTKKQREQNKIKKVTCPPPCCFSWEIGTKICPICGHNFKIPSEKKRKEFQMHELDEKLINVNHIEQMSAAALQENIERIKKYKNQKSAMTEILHSSIRDGELNMKEKIDIMCRELNFDKEYQNRVWRHLKKEYGERLDRLA